MDVKGVVVVDHLRAESEPLGPRWPKALEHVANRPIIHHVLDELATAGVSEIVVAVSGEAGAYVRGCLDLRDDLPESRLRYVEQPGQLEFGDALRLVSPIIGRCPCVVHPAAGLLGESLIPMVDDLRSNPTDMVLTVQRAAADRPASADLSALLAAAEPAREPQSLRVAGVSLFGPDALLSSLTTSRDRPAVGPTAAAEGLMAQGGSVRVLQVSSWHHYEGDAVDLLELNRIALDRLDPGLCGEVDGNRLEGRVSIDEAASVTSSVIVGPTVIGPGACIADAYIGPYTSVGAGARIEGAEIERSIVAAGASVMHVSRRLVASVVGRNARISRDFSLPRALRLRIGDGAVVALS